MAAAPAVYSVVVRGVGRTISAFEQHLCTAKSDEEVPDTGWSCKIC